MDVFLGETPNPIKGTKAVVKINEPGQRFEEGKYWSVKLLNAHEKTITLEVENNVCFTINQTTLSRFFF